MNKIKWFFINAVGIIMLVGCSHHDDNSEHATHSHENHGHHDEHDEVEKGPHNGRLLVQGDFELELAIFETGMPPEFRVWSKSKGEHVRPEDVRVNIKLARLGGRIDSINFTPLGDALRGDMEIYEPHSFQVTVTANYQDKQYQWQYDNFEGRTKIEKKIADGLNIETAFVSPAVLNETISVFGELKNNAERVRDIHARFNGVIKSVKPALGSYVKKGELLATIESNESLNVFNINAPIDGVITYRNANVGEQTNSRRLFTIVDNTSMWAEFAIFPSVKNKVKLGSEVTVYYDGNLSINGVVDYISVIADTNQSVKARVNLNNKSGTLVSGRFVQAEISVATHPVKMAVKRSGLQSFRDFTVVYQKISDEYEVRMLELGKQDKQWVEVISGIDVGAEYVTKNSYIIKADIEKSGASHDH